MNNIFLTAFYLFILFFSSVSLVSAEEATTEHGVIKNSISFSQMGRINGLYLSNIQHQTGINFTLPKNEVITKATLFLDIETTFQKRDQTTSLKLILNGQPLKEISLPLDNSGIKTYQIEIPALLVTSYNNLGFQITNGEEHLCFQDTNDEYQLRVLSTSHITFEAQHLNIASNLSNFPLPFFDAAKMSQTDITFAFPNALTEHYVSAAVMLASWFGVEANYRDISFNTLSGELPPKNGIIIGAPGEVIGRLILPNTDKPQLKIIANPSAQSYKLLLIIGNNKTELVSAVWRLINGHFDKNIDEYYVENQSIPQSAAYDAPRWINTDRPVKLSELLQEGQSMTVSGVWHEPLQVNFRASPDLFLWDGQNIPMHIEYRFPLENWIDEENSYLNLTFNNQFLQDLPLKKKGSLESLWHKLGADSRQESADIPIEPYMIYGDNQLSLYFDVATKPNVPCEALLDNNIKSRITEDSWIDLSQTKHFSLLPNLSYFVGASFPFSKVADYSETSLLLPKNPTQAEISTLLNLAARSGNSTGVSLNNNNVFFGVPSTQDKLALFKSNDILAVSSIRQEQFNRELLTNSPFITNGQTLSVKQISAWESFNNWIKGDWDLNILEADRYFNSKQTWRGFISYRSPWNNDRVVVLATGSEDSQLLQLNSDLMDSKINAEIRGDAAIITNENGVRSFKVAAQFPSGQLPWYMIIIWYANQHSAILAMLGLLITLIIGQAFSRALHRKASKRLSPNSAKIGNKNDL